MNNSGLLNGAFKIKNNDEPKDFMEIDLNFNVVKANKVIVKAAELLIKAN